MYLYGEHSLNCVGDDANTLPDVLNQKTGVSVRYIQSPEHFWYVFRASYGRSDKAADIMIEDGTYAYVAKRYVFKFINGKKKRILEPLIPNLVFAYTTPKRAYEYVCGRSGLFFLSYYYDHFKLIEQHKNPPLIIPNEEMENFIHATASHNEHIAFVEPSKCHYKSGDLVKVTDGLFKGVVGRVARVSGQQRVVLSLSKVGLISTAYIPTAFIEKLSFETDNNEKDNSF